MSLSADSTHRVDLYIRAVQLMLIYGYGLQNVSVFDNKYPPPVSLSLSLHRYALSAPFLTGLDAYRRDDAKCPLNAKKKRAFVSP